MRILLVGQDANLLAETRRAFWRDHRGWETLFAASGAEALQLLGRDPVDILVSDMRLPDMSGAELFHEVRGIEPGTVRPAKA